MKLGDPNAAVRVHDSAGRLAWLTQAITDALASNSDECLLTCPFMPPKGGYPFVGRRYAHEIVLEAVEGPRPPGHVARHLCGNGHLGCLHPRHLAWGTVADNHADRIGHGTTFRGGRAYNAKLTESDVRAIRASMDTEAALGSRYGINPNYAGMVRRRKRWAWLE